ncbi:MAG: hypothetical protein EPN20_15230 [Magnetospirillum sp.]|nr:MAG: hypothetical protein EPN20_15230 [Magnetospirillum sp.]
MAVVRHFAINLVRTIADKKTITLVRLPPYSPALNPVERIWLFLRERFLSLCIWPDPIRHRPGLL